MSTSLNVRRRRINRSAPAMAVLAAADPAGKGLVAAARRILAGSNKVLIQTTERQTEAWRQYDICPELGFAANWLGNALSRCRFYVADKDPDSGEVIGETKDERAQAVLSGLTGNPGRVSEMLHAIGIDITVPGEFYILAEFDPDDELDPDAPGAFNYWCVLSTEEVSRGGRDGWIKVRTADGKNREVSLEKAILIRCHRPHPKHKDEADSPAMRALPALRELEQLTKYLFALMDSRLAGNGILAMPNEFTFPTPGDDLQPGEDPFMAVLTEAMVTPIGDRNHASSVVPIVIKGPGDQIGNIHHITFSSELTAVVNELREKAVRTLAIGLDMPPEVLLGVGGTNHWNAEYIDEASIKVHIEPALTLVAGALTSGFLELALEAEGLDPARYCVWYDSSPLVLRPDRSEDASKAHEAGIISDETYRTALGFTDEDAPKPEDLRTRAVDIALELIKGAPSLAADPGLGPLVADLLAVLQGDETVTIDIPVPEPVVPPAAPDPEVVTRTVPGRPADPTQ